METDSRHDPWANPPLTAPTRPGETGAGGTVRKIIALPKVTELARPGGTESASPGAVLARRGKKVFLAALGSALTYDPRPLDAPKVMADFHQVSMPVRMLETLRYSVALVEYRVGPNGWLRAWLFLWLGLLLCVLVPLGAVGALLWLLVPLFQIIAEIAHSLESACGSLLWAAVYVAGILAIVAVVIVVARLRARNDPCRGCPNTYICRVVREI
jgi:hypothetical protein